MDLTTLRNRITRGEEYLLALENFRNREWRAIFADYDEGRLTVPEAMVLVHPRFYNVREASVGQSIRGDRNFANVAGREVSPCMADQIWLSSCRLQNTEDLQSDHWFPFSLGGPTVASNQLYLCAVHNYSKSSDVHLFPWEHGEPAWFRTQVERIQNMLT